MDESTILIAKNVEKHKSCFDSVGGMLSFELPEGCTAVILVGNSGGGWKPFRFLLPHQVYLKDIAKAFADHHFEVIGVVPIVSADIFPVVYKNDYSKQRWKDLETTHENPAS